MRDGRWRSITVSPVSPVTGDKSNAQVRATINRDRTAYVSCAAPHMIRHRVDHSNTPVGRRVARSAACPGSALSSATPTCRGPLPPAGSALSASLVNDPSVTLRTLDSAILSVYPHIHVAVIADPADSIDDASGVTACTQLRSVPSICRPTKKAVPADPRSRGIQLLNERDALPNFIGEDHQQQLRRRADSRTRESASTTLRLLQTDDSHTLLPCPGASSTPAHSSTTRLACRRKTWALVCKGVVSPRPGR